MRGIRSLVIFVVFITLVVSIHEAGHMFMAQAFGVTVEKFGIGFGEPFISWKMSNVEYSVNSIPIGGYVEINDKSLAEASLVAKVLILLAGPFANLLLFIFFIALYTNLLFEVSDPKTKKKLPAAKQYFIVLWIILRVVGQLLWGILKFFKKEGTKGLGGPVAMLENSYDMAEKKIKKNRKNLVLQFSIYNVALFFFNLIPIPALDGGRVGIVVLEAIFGPSPIYSKLILASFILLIALAVLLTARDSFRVAKRIINSFKERKISKAKK